MNMFEVVGYLAIVWLISCVVFIPSFMIVCYLVNMKNNKIPANSDSVWVNGVNIHHDTNGGSENQPPLHELSSEQDYCNHIGSLILKNYMIDQAFLDRVQTPPPV